MTRFLSFAGILTYYGFNILRFGLWLRLLGIDPARSAPPLRGGRRIESLRAFRRAELLSREVSTT